MSTNMLVGIINRKLTSMLDVCKLERKRPLLGACGLVISVFWVYRITQMTMFPRMLCSLCLIVLTAYSDIAVAVNQPGQSGTAHVPRSWYQILLHLCREANVKVDVGAEYIVVSFPKPGVSQNVCYRTQRTRSASAGGLPRIPHHRLLAGTVSLQEGRPDWNPTLYYARAEPNEHTCHVVHTDTERGLDALKHDVHYKCVGKRPENGGGMDVLGSYPRLHYQHSTYVIL